MKKFLISIDTSIRLFFNKFFGSILLSIMISAIFPSSGRAVITDPGAAGTALYVSINKYISLTKKYNLPRRPFKGSPCPFRSDKFSDLVAKMSQAKTLFNPQGKCKASHSNEINELEKSFTEFNQINKSLQSTGAIPRDDGKQVETPAPPTGTLNPNEQVAQTKAKTEAELVLRKVQLTATYLGNLAEVVKDAHCQTDLKGSEWLDIIGDIVLNTANFGMIGGGAAGYIFAAGGQALGSVLKIISFLIKSKFQFFNEKEREAFLKMTCSYSELYGEIDESGILTVKTHQHDREIDSYSKDIKEIDKELLRLEEVIHYFQEKQKGQLEGLRDSAMGKDMATFLRAVEKIQDIVLRVLPQSTERRTISEALEVFYESHKTILEKFNLAKTNNLFELTNKYDLKDQDEALTQVSKAMGQFASAEAFADHHYKNRAEIAQRGEDYLKYLNWPQRKLKEMELQKMYKKQGTTAFSVLLNPTKFRAELHLERFQYLKEHFKNEIAFRKRLDKGGVFPNSVEGNQDKATILEGLKGGQDMIYGKAGDSFLKYVIDIGKLNLEDFFAQYTTFKAAPPNSKEKCSLGLSLNQEYGLAQSHTQLGVDFIEANKYLFYEPRGLFKRIPFTNDRARQNVTDQVKSYEEAKKKLASQQAEVEMDVTPGMASPRDPKLGKTIGYCMNGVQQATFKKKRIQSQTQNCGP